MLTRLVLVASLLASSVAAAAFHPAIPARSNRGVRPLAETVLSAMRVVQELTSRRGGAGSDLVVLGKDGVPTLIIRAHSGGVTLVSARAPEVVLVALAPGLTAAQLRTALRDVRSLTSTSVEAALALWAGPI